MATPTAASCTRTKTSPSASATNSCRPRLTGKEWWTRTITDRQAAAKRRTPPSCSTKSPKAPGFAATPACNTTAPSRNGTPARAPSRFTPPIRAREYVFLNNTACNLASLNLMKFKREDGKFDIERFKAAVRIFITAQEIIVDNASYPTKDIAENSHIFRTLGLGFANLGSLIMSYGLPYDSDEGRALAGAITAIMTGHAYEQSRRNRRGHGAVHRLPRRPLRRGRKSRREGQRRIHARRHQAASRRRRRHPSERRIRLSQRRGAQDAGTARSPSGKQFGYRNAQVTVLAPDRHHRASSWIATPPASSPTSRW